MAVTSNVPDTSGSTPYAGGLNSAAHRVPPRKSPTSTLSKNLTVGGISEITMAIVVATERVAAATRTTLIAASPYRGRDRPRDLRGGEAAGTVDVVTLISASAAGGCRRFERLEIRLQLGLLRGVQRNEPGLIGDLLRV